MNSEIKQTFLRGGYQSYSKPEAERDGYRDFADFYKWNPDAKVLSIFQEITRREVHGDTHIYKVFYTETTPVSVATPVSATTDSEKE